MIKFYKVVVDDALLVHDTESGVYAPFTLTDKPLTLQGCAEWWGTDTVSDHYTLLTPEESAEYRVMGMVEIM